ncbi:MAG: hypothetical protein R2845_13400 [Thermomicrobiales bacterium]
MTVADEPESPGAADDQPDADDFDDDEDLEVVDGEVPRYDRTLQGRRSRS